MNKGLILSWYLLHKFILWNLLSLFFLFYYFLFHLF